MELDMYTYIYIYISDTDMYHNAIHGWSGIFIDSWLNDATDEVPGLVLGDILFIDSLAQRAHDPPNVGS